MPNKVTRTSSTTQRKNLQEDGITNPKDGRGPLRKVDDASTKLPLQTGAHRPTRPH
jgi:hypothetical protein